MKIKILLRSKIKELHATIFSKKNVPKLFVEEKPIVTVEQKAFGKKKTQFAILITKYHDLISVCI